MSDEPLEVMVSEEDRRRADLHIAVDALSAELRRERTARQKAEMVIAEAEMVIAEYGARLRLLGHLDEAGNLLEIDD